MRVQRIVAILALCAAAAVSVVFVSITNRLIGDISTVLQSAPGGSAVATAEAEAKTYFHGPQFQPYPVLVVVQGRFGSIPQTPIDAFSEALVKGIASSTLRSSIRETRSPGNDQFSQFAHVGGITNDTAVIAVVPAPDADVRAVYHWVTAFSAAYPKTVPTFGEAGLTLEVTGDVSLVVRFQTVLARYTVLFVAIVAVSIAVAVPCAMYVRPTQRLQVEDGDEPADPIRSASFADLAQGLLQDHTPAPREQQRFRAMRLFCGGAAFLVVVGAVASIGTVVPAMWLTTVLLARPSVSFFSASVATIVTVPMVCLQTAVVFGAFLHRASQERLPSDEDSEYSEPEVESLTDDASTPTTAPVVPHTEQVQPAKGWCSDPTSTIARTAVAQLAPFMVCIGFTVLFSLVAASAVSSDLRDLSAMGPISAVLSGALIAVLGPLGLVVFFPVEAQQMKPIRHLPWEAVTPALLARFPQLPRWGNGALIAVRFGLCGVLVVASVVELVLFQTSPRLTAPASIMDSGSLAKTYERVISRFPLWRSYSLAFRAVGTGELWTDTAFDEVSNTLHELSNVTGVDPQNIFSPTWAAGTDLNTEQALILQTFDEGYKFGWLHMVDKSTTFMIAVIEPPMSSLQATLGDFEAALSAAAARAVQHPAFSYVGWYGGNGPLNATDRETIPRIMPAFLCAVAASAFVVFAVWQRRGLFHAPTPSANGRDRVSRRRAAVVWLRNLSRAFAVVASLLSIALSAVVVGSGAWCIVCRLLGLLPLILWLVPATAAAVGVPLAVAAELVTWQSLQQDQAAVPGDEDDVKLPGHCVWACEAARAGFALASLVAIVASDIPTLRGLGVLLFTLVATHQCVIGPLVRLPLLSRLQL